MRARMVESVVKGLPDAGDGERVYCKEAARRCGYLGEESWDDILNGPYGIERQDEDTFGEEGGVTPSFLL